MVLNLSSCSVLLSSWKPGLAYLATEFTLITLVREDVSAGGSTAALGGTVRGDDCVLWT